jgi:hypothetical protein
MSEEQLSSFQARMAAMPANEVIEPEIPAAVAIQEANDLVTLCRQPDIAERLFRVGLDEADLQDLDEAVGAMRTAQSMWVVVRDRSKSDAQKEREENGYRLRGDLLAALRFNLRADRAAMGTVDAIAEGEGLADLIQDLADAARLIESRLDAFVRDQTFDAPAAAEEARQLSEELSAGASLERIHGEQINMKDSRDRMYSLMADIVSSVREAGRYAFRDDETLRAKFASDYQRRRRVRYERAKAAAAARAEPA